MLLRCAEIMHLRSVGKIQSHLLSGSTLTNEATLRAHPGVVTTQSHYGEI